MILIYLPRLELILFITSRLNLNIKHDVIRFFISFLHFLNLSSLRAKNNQNAFIFKRELLYKHI